MNDIMDQIVTGVSRFVERGVADVYRLWRAHVRGVEVTQSIQYYRSDEHMADPADRLPDNSVELVAYKAARVRVYVRPGFISPENVTGTLEVARRNQVMTYNVVGTYSPQGLATVSAQDGVAYNTERNGLNLTLNFVIPAADFWGTLRLTVRLTGITGSDYVVDVRPKLVQTLRIRAILVAYNGPSSANPPGPGQPPITQLTLAAPTLADLQNTASLSFATMPVQATGSFASCGTLNWATPLDDPRTSPGACSTNWDTLLNWLGLLRDNDGNRNDVVYYGLLPAAIPLGVPGCGENGLGSGVVGDQMTLLHEIGHGYGFAHTPCGNVGTPDPNYPTYEPYGMASIGEFGFDIRDGTIYDPNTARDYMSYCGPRWMSLYQHNRLIQHPRLAPRWISERSIFDEPVQHPFDLEHLWWPDPPWLPDEVLDRRMNPVISIVGRVVDTGVVEVQSVARISVAGEPRGLATRWVAQLVDGSGNAIARAPLMRVQHHGGCDCGCGGADAAHVDDPPFSFKAYLPNVAPGAALRILSPEKEVWSRPAPARRPRFVRVEGRLTDRQELALRWQVEAASEVDVWAQWTNDGGEHWHGLAVGLRGEGAQLPLTGLPGGPVQIRLRAHDGFYTTESGLLNIELPERAPQIAILHPRDGQTLRAGNPFQVAGSAVDSAGYPLPGEQLRWLLDGRAIGHGRELWLAEMHEGRHELVLEVGWSRGKARVNVTFSTA